jgi:hypothetical protein
MMTRILALTVFLACGDGRHLQLLGLVDVIRGGRLLRRPAAYRMAKRLRM